MTSSPNDLIEHLLTRLREVQRNFRFEETGDPNVPLAEVLDSMGLVELVAILAEDFGVTSDTIDQAVGRKYGAIVEVARHLRAAGLSQNVQNRSEKIADRIWRVTWSMEHLNRHISEFQHFSVFQRRNAYSVSALSWSTYSAPDISASLRPPET